MEKPKLPVYKSWEEVPSVLKTKTQLASLGLKPAKDQQVIAYKASWYHRGQEYALYDSSLCEAKRPATPAQREALRKGQLTIINNRTCVRCGIIDAEVRYDHKKLCRMCLFSDFLEESRQEACQWAGEVVTDGDAVIIDTETTGLDGTDQVIEIALVDMGGNIRLNTRVKPTVAIQEGAYQVHGIREADLSGAPAFGEIWPSLAPLLEGASRIIVYNADFDSRLLDQSMRAAGIEWELTTPFECAMEHYAAYCGEWSSYYRSFKWQRLGGGDHTAAGDCLATWHLLRRMAETVSTDGEKTPAFNSKIKNTV